MSRIALLLLAIAMAFAFFRGSGGHGEQKARTVAGIRPERQYPVLEQRPFVIVLYAHNAASWCERSLRSIFEQDHERYRVLFIDDASSDQSLEKAQEFLVDNQIDDRVGFMQNERRVGFAASLYEAIEQCLDHEIVVPMDAANWLAHEGVLAALNRAFQNPDVWIALGQEVAYPSFELREEGFHAFYAALFKPIRLGDLIAGGSIADTGRLYLSALQEEAGGRLLALQEPLLIANEARVSRKATPCLEKSPRRTPYQPLARLPSSTGGQPAFIDVVVRSSDAPEHLRAFLASAERFLIGDYQITACYAATTPLFEEQYRSLCEEFPAVRYVRSGEKPSLDPASRFILSAIDENLFKESVDLGAACRLLDRTGAETCLLGIGGKEGIALGYDLYAREKQGAPESFPGPLLYPKEAVPSGLAICFDRAKAETCPAASRQH